MTTLSLLQASRALVAALGEECFHVEAGTCGPFKMDEQCGNHGLSWPCPVDALRAAIAAAEAEAPCATCAQMGFGDGYGHQQRDAWWREDGLPSHPFALAEESTDAR